MAITLKQLKDAADAALATGNYSQAKQILIRLQVQLAATPDGSQGGGTLEFDRRQIELAIKQCDRQIAQARLNCKGLFGVSKIKYVDPQ